MKWVVLFFGLACLLTWLACTIAGVNVLIQAKTVFDQNLMMQLFTAALEAFIGAAVSAGFFGTILALEKRAAHQ